MPNRKDKFKPRAEAGLLSRLIQEAWKEYQDSFANETEQARVAEALATHFEIQIPLSDFEVLDRWGCIARHDTCNVSVYDSSQPERPFAERFGFNLPRRIPVVGASGYGYPSLVACCPYARKDSVSTDLDSYFASLLTARKAYQAEYKASGTFPQEHKEATGSYPTWGEIEDRFPVLGEYLKNHRACEKVTK